MPWSPLKTPKIGKQYTYTMRLRGKYLNLENMRKLILSIFIVTAFVNSSFAQDANNPIDPHPTFALFNRAYEGKSLTQFVGNATINDWFFRLSAEQAFNYDASNNFNGANILVSRLFHSQDNKHKFGLGAIASYFHSDKYAGGVNFVSVSKFGEWKVISLTTLQGGDDLFKIEFQPGVYRDINDKGWYLRSHPRLLFDVKTDVHEVPLGAGVGKITKFEGGLLNLFIEPQYDFANNGWIGYVGVKVLL